ncbi:GSCFA domain-containing protein [Gemmobacter sp.]|uniref:GSCFA domain-containing protein n=1 Tax=Gemmobacter sp. TaxID=1898957 RepID=UPI002AFE4D02|nr:GSCFA domain-containing protein [Gemmobacter sp.]
MTQPAPNPYASLPANAFWRSGVAEAGVFGLRDLWQSRWTLPQDARFATFGSCFAQHISRALKARNMGWINGEPAPPGAPPDLSAAYNYGVFSARTANIYTAAQLRLLLQMVTGTLPVDAAEIWADPDGRFRDSLRPAIEPAGFATRAEALASRRAMLRGLRRAVTGADVFVFTLGLTEGWESATGQPYSACPGTIGGIFDPAQHRFVNYRHAAIRAALDDSLVLLRAMNPDIHLLLTVSPVPLTATASGKHVLAATTYSKSVLRAVAGEMTEDEDRVDYFPSYEIITGAPTRAAFYAPNLRSVEPQGVEVVMGHFFAGLSLTAAPRHGDTAAAEAAQDAAVKATLQAEDLACEEAMLESFNAS